MPNGIYLEINGIAYVKTIDPDGWENMETGERIDSEMFSQILHKVSTLKIGDTGTLQHNHSTVFSSNITQLADVLCIIVNLIQQQLLPISNMELPSHEKEVIAERILREL